MPVREPAAWPQPEPVARPQRESLAWPQRESLAWPQRGGTGAGPRHDPVGPETGRSASGILFVCYANLCRSPMAEYLARDLLAGFGGTDPAGFPVSSAGTHAVAGSRMHPHAATVAAGLGADPGGFRSRPLTADVIAQAGLVLAATHRERAACVSLVPGAMRRTFTLRQFGRLAAAAGPDGPDGAPSGGSGDGPDKTPACGLDDGQDLAGRLAAVVFAATRARGRLQPVGPGEDDLADPVGQPIAAFRRCAGEIEQALAPVMRLIASCG
jgi:protein-tyrosine phosphatase